MNFLRRNKEDSSAPRRRQAAAESGERAPKQDLKQRYSFQRNRTITGSASSNVTATGELGAELKSPRVHAHHLSLRRRRVGFALAGALMGIVLLYVLIVQFAASVSFAVAGMPEHSESATDRYVEIANEYYSKYPLQRIGIFFDDQQFLAHMRVEAGEILDIEAHRSPIRLAHVLFTVEPRKPVVSWTVDGNQLFVDGDGVAFSVNYYGKPEVKIVDESGIPTEKDKAVASNRFLGSVGRLVEFTGQYGYTVEKVSIPANTTRQVNLKVKGLSYEIRCLIDRPAGVQAEDIDRAVRGLKSRGQSPKYVDVRVSGRAYYQ